MKQLSCGVLIINSKNQILGCKSFGRKDGRHDIPKGKIEEGETTSIAAIRETFEETGLSFRDEDLTDLGEFTYTKRKNLHLFKANRDVDNLSFLGCCTTFTLKGIEHPEIVGYEWIDTDSESLLNKFYKPLGIILNEILNNLK